MCRFRHRHLKDFRELFVEVVRVARRMGLVRFGTLSMDGTRVRANGEQTQGDVLRSDDPVDPGARTAPGHDGGGSAALRPGRPVPPATVGRGAGTSDAAP